MDSIDRKILALLQKNARMTVKELAGRVSLSAPSVAARIQKMEESGVISGYHAVINTEMAGYPIRAFYPGSGEGKTQSGFFQTCEKEQGSGGMPLHYRGLRYAYRRSFSENQGYQCVC